MNQARDLAPVLPAKTSIRFDFNENDKQWTEQKVVRRLVVKVAKNDRRLNLTGVGTGHASMTDQN